VSKSPHSTEIYAESHSSLWERIDPDTLYLKRVQHPSKKLVEADTTGKFWWLSYAKIPKGQLRVRRGKRLIDIYGEGAMYLPPYSIVEWHLEPGIVEFESILCSKEVPDFFPKTPIRFQPPFPGLPRSLPGTVEYLRGASEIVYVGVEEGNHPLAQRVKAVIDRSFASETSLAEIADGLSTSPSSMARQFREAYGISPVKYRNSLRITTSWCTLLASGAPVTEVGHLVGFKDLSRYNKQFRRRIKTVPSQYRIS